MKIKKSFKKLFSNVKKSQFFKRLGIAIGSSIVFVAFIFCVLNFVYNNKIFPHTYIGSTNFSGLNRAQAEEVLMRLESQNQNGKLSFSFEGKDYILSNVDLKVNWSAKNHETLNYLFGIGRTGGPGKVLSEQTRSLLGKNHVFAAYNFDGTKLSEFIQTISKDVNKPEKNASIEIINEQPVVIPEEIGRIFPLEENNKIIYETIGSFRTINQTGLLVREVNPQVDARGAQLALYETEQMLKRILGVKAGDKTYDLKGEDLIGLLKYITVVGNKGVLGISSDDIFEPKSVLVLFSLALDANPDKIGEFVDKIASEVNQESKDAKFEVKGGKVSAFQLAQTGYEIDKEKAVQIIIAAIKNNNNQVELPVKITEPTISDNAEENGIKELVGQGTTNFSGSPKNRKYNINVGAMSLHGIIVKPGEEFSTLKHIGQVDASTGYLPELVIKENRTEPEYGGGLCQVSTTLFRAVLKTGLKVTDRTNHSYRVGYYEPPVGMDATIYIPKPDFKFVNDMKTPVLIQASVGTNTITFSFYGTKDGRRSETTNPYVYSVTGSGEPIYTENPSLGAGEIKRVETAHPGAKASFKYTVWDSLNKVINEQNFVSSYVPWPARYFYGPGTTGIPGQEDPAPEPEADPGPTPTPTPFVKIVE